MRRGTYARQRARYGNAEPPRERPCYHVCFAMPVHYGHVYEESAMLRNARYAHAQNVTMYVYAIEIEEMA